jgi:hypothetical protein
MPLHPGELRRQTIWVADIVGVLECDPVAVRQLGDDPVLDLIRSDVRGELDRADAIVAAEAIDDAIKGAVAAGVVDAEDFEVGVRLCLEPLEAEVDPGLGVEHRQDDADEIRTGLRRDRTHELSRRRRVQPGEDAPTAIDFRPRVARAQVAPREGVGLNGGNGRSGQCPGGRRAVAARKMGRDRRTRAVLRCLSGSRS